VSSKTFFRRYANRSEVWDKRKRLYFINFFVSFI